MWDNTTSYDAIFLIVMSCAMTLAYQVLMLRLRYHAIRSWRHTTGTVVGRTEKMREERSEPKYRYVYEIGGQRYMANRAGASDFFAIYREPALPLEVAHDVVVYVHPSKPALSVLRRAPAERITTIHVCALLACIAIAVCVAGRVGSVLILVVSATSVSTLAALTESVRYKCAVAKRV